MSTIQELERQLAQAEAETARLRRAVEVKKALDESLTPAERVGGYLHDRLCVLNHTDDCTWDYTQWGGRDAGDPNGPGTINYRVRERYLRAGQKILSTIWSAGAVHEHDPMAECLAYDIIDAIKEARY